MTKYVRSNENITSRIQDEVVMVNLTQGNYYALNEVGSSIWNIIETPHSIEEIAEILLMEYAVNKETCINEISDFINQLLEHKVIEKVT